MDLLREALNGFKIVLELYLCATRNRGVRSSPLMLRLRSTLRAQKGLTIIEPRRDSVITSVEFPNKTQEILLQMDTSQGVKY